MDPKQKSSEQEPEPNRAPAPETVDQTKEGDRLRKIERERIEKGEQDSGKKHH